MDFLNRTYAATLLEQSRFYFPPLGGMRSAPQEARPPVATNTASPAFLELGLPRGGPREREIPLDLSTKNLRQGADATDSDVIVLEHRRRNQLQLAAALAAGKLPFAFGAQGGPFLGAPHLSLFPHDMSAAYRNGDGSAFLTPPSNLHSAICGGLNGFCLDPHRCRFASLSMAAASASSGGGAGRHPAEAFPGASPYAVFERHLAKLAPGYADLLPPVSSSGAPSTPTTSSAELLKQHQHFAAANGDAYLAPFSLAAPLGLPTYHPNGHPKEAPPTSCSSFLPGPYQLPCACCYPSTAAPPRGYDAHSFAAPALLPRDPSFADAAKDKVKREATPVPKVHHQSNGKHPCKSPVSKTASPPSKPPVVCHRPASPVKPQAEGGRWIPHPHSHHAHKDKMAAAAEAPPVIKSEVTTPAPSPAPMSPSLKHSVPSPVENPLKAYARPDLPVAEPEPMPAKVEPMPEQLAEAPPTIDRWMLSSLMDADDKSRSVPASWNPAEVKREFNVVAPVVAHKSSRMSELPASPAEGCAPVSAEPKTNDGTVGARSDVISGSVPANLLSESPLQILKVEPQWKTPIKRASSDLGAVPSKKKRKKDVIVISMREDHQGHREVLMKSVKRKLNSDHVNGYVPAPPADERFSTDPAVAAALLGLHAHHFHHQRPAEEKPEKRPCSPPDGGEPSEGPELQRPPPIGVTLVKTGHPGPNQYKSSVLHVGAHHPKGGNEDTSAMLRLYYEQQKQRLQDAESPPGGQRKRALSPHAAVQPQRRLPQPSFRKQEEDEARDGDDEREDDNEEDDGDEMKRRRNQSKDGAHDVDERRGTNENIENEKNANNHIQLSVPEPVTPAAPINTSNVPTTPVASRVESTKRLMINKALGETTLHRAARLGYLDVLSYCLETQAISIDARDNAGYTPLHECCSRGHLEIARQLLQHGADPNASAAGGIRPIHDAIEYDRLEIVRLLLSYGADPVIATYSGLTPLKLARSPIMLEFLKGYLADINGESDSPVMPWQFHGSASFFDPWPTGYDPLLDLPSEDESSDLHEGDVGEDDDVDNGAALIFEVSDKPHIPTYRVPASRRNGSGMLRFCLLQDVLHQTAMDRDAFLSCYPDIQVATMPRQEFAARAKCTQLMVDVSGALEACPPSPWVEFVHWDDTIRDILDIERVSIPRLDD